MMYGLIILAILIIVLVVTIGTSHLSLWNTQTDAASNFAGSPEETLRDRYAKGEMDEAEYEKKKTELEKTS